MGLLGQTGLRTKMNIECKYVRGTVCPISPFQFYTVIQHIKRDKTSWTSGMKKRKIRHEICSDIQYVQKVLFICI